MSAPSTAGWPAPSPVIGNVIVILYVSGDVHGDVQVDVYVYEMRKPR